VLACFCALGLAFPAAAAAAPARYTLAVGDSVAYGTINGAPGSGARFQGFVDLLAARIAVLRPGHVAINYSCPGATTTAILGPAPSSCQGADQYAPHTGSQLAAALAFLTAHPGDVSPIVVTAGGNDLLDGDDPAAIAGRARQILAALRAAAPGADLVLTGYGDPRSLGEPDQAARYATHATFNERLRGAAAAAGAAFADPHPVFNASPTAVCTYLRACDGGDPHPTGAGHEVYARLIFDALGYGAVAPEPVATAEANPSFGTPATAGVRVPEPQSEVLGARAGAPARFGAPRLTADRRLLRVWVRCASDRPRTCRVLVVVRQRGRELGRGRVRLSPGRTATVRVALRRRAARGTRVQISAYVGDAPRPTVRLTAR
jgi:lysophospholipase L1-like esterase